MSDCKPTRVMYVMVHASFRMGREAEQHPILKNGKEANHFTVTNSLLE